MNFRGSSVIVPTITSVYKGVKRFFRDPFYLIHGVCQRMPVIRVTVKRFGADEPTATAGSRNTYFAAKLIAFVDLPFAYAFYFRGMDTVDFVLLISCSLLNAGGNV